MIDAINDSKTGTIIPIHKDRASIIDAGNSSLVAWLQLRVRIIHADQLYACSFRIQLTQEFDDRMIWKLIISHTYHLPFSRRVCPHRYH